MSTPVQVSANGWSGRFPRCNGDFGLLATCGQVYGCTGVTADFAGGLISSDGGLVLLRGAERRLGLSETLAGCIREWRDPERVVHVLPGMLRFRMFAIACGYEDADDCDALRGDPLFKLAVGRAPESGRDLCSQPTMSRLENAPSRIEVARMTAALVDTFRFFGGVCRRGIYDNMKTAVSRVRQGRRLLPSRLRPLPHAHQRAQRPASRQHLHRKAAIQRSLLLWHRAHLQELPIHVESRFRRAAQICRVAAHPRRTQPKLALFPTDRA